jgi:hypothetical protein
VNLAEGTALLRVLSPILALKGAVSMTRTTAHPLPTRIAFALLWMFVFTLPLTQVVEIPYVGMISKALGLAAMTAGAVAVAARRRIRLPGGVHMALAGFIVWSVVTLSWSIAPQLTMQRIMEELQLFVLVLLIWEFCAEEKEVLKILGAFVLGTIVPALSTLKAFLPGEHALYDRSAAGVDPNTLAFTLALSLPVAYYLILREKGPVSALYRLQMGFAVCAILFSGSAATLIAMAVGLSLVCWTFHLVPARTRGGAFGLVVLAGLAGLLMMPASLWQHLSEESMKNGVTMASLTDSLHSTPVGGFGAGALAVTGIHAPAGHNAALTMFSETGVIGVACFIVLFGALFLAAEKMSGASKSFWFTVLAVWTVGACALSWECAQPAWLLFGLLAAHAECLNQKAVSREEQAQKRNYYVEQSAEVWS